MPKITIDRSIGGLPTTTGTPQARGSFVSDALGRGLQSVGQAVSDVGDAMEALKQKKEKLKASEYRTTESIKLDDKIKASEQSLQNDFADNPDGYRDAYMQQFDNEWQSVIENAPNDAAKMQLMNDYRIQRASKNTTAMTWEESQFLNNYIINEQTNLDTLRNRIINDPSSMNQHMLKYEEILASGKEFRDEKEYQRFLDGNRAALQKTVALSLGRAGVDSSGSAKAGLDYLKSEQAITTLTPEEILSTESSLLSYEKARRDEARKLNEKLQTDSAFYAIAMGAKTPEEIKQIQVEAGVLPGNISLMPNDRAKKEANDFNGIITADGAVQKLDALREEYGDENLNIVLKDLSNNGLSSQITFISQLDPTQNYDLVNASFEMAKEGQNTINNVKAKKITQTEINNKVVNRVDTISKVLANEGMIGIKSLASNITPIVTYLVDQGATVSDAVEQATRWLPDNNNLGQVKGKHFRIPPGSGLTVSQAENGIKSIIENLQPEDVNDIYTKFNFQFENFKDVIIPVPDQTGSAYILLNADKKAITDKEGNSLRYTFDQVMVAAETRFVERRSPLARDRKNQGLNLKPTINEMIDFVKGTDAGASTRKTSPKAK